jgi:hypothetical protein
MTIDSTVTSTNGAQNANPVDASSIFTGFELRMGVFARLSQTTFLLGQTLELLKNESTYETIALSSRKSQLRRTLLALVHATDSEASVRVLEFCAQSGLSFRYVDTFVSCSTDTHSTILLLQERELRGKPKTAFDNLWSESQNALNRLAAASASHLASRKSSDRIPIFMIHVMYQATCVLLLLTPESKVEASIRVMKEVLRMIDERWRLAGVFLTIIDSLEATSPPGT